MGFLRYQDYKQYIQNANLSQIIASDDTIRTSVENTAQAEMISYLTGKFDCDAVFAPTTVFSLAATYKANALVELNYTAWAVGNYTVGKYVSYTNGNCYYCKTNTVANQIPTDTTYWTLLGPLYALYYIPYPELLFDLKGIYKVGDKAFWKNKVYTCVIGTTLPSHNDILQDGVYSNVPPYNIFPDDPVSGLKYWGAGVAYSVTGKTPQEDPWTLGDNRNTQLVMYMIRILVYHISSRLSPNNTPVEIEKRYMGAMEDRIKYKGKIIYPAYSALGWLHECANTGDTTVNLPQSQPDQDRINYGGNIKQINGY